MSAPVSENHENGLAFTSADLLVVVTLFAVILGAYSTFGLWAAGPVAFVVAIVLVCLGHHHQRRLARVMGRLLVVPSFFLTVYVAWIAVLIAFDPNYLRDSWPDEIEGLAQHCQARIGDVRVHCLGSFIDTEHVWRQSLPVDRLDLALDYLDVEPLADETATPYFFARFPFLWRPGETGHRKFFASPDFSVDSRGSDGNYFFVMYDFDGQRLYVWNKNNF